MSENPFEQFELISDPIARSRSILKNPVKSGRVIFSARPLTAVLLPDQKRGRCDGCMRRHDSHALKACTGCKTQWYCGEPCQVRAWKTYHRKLCKRLPAFIAGQEYQSLSDAAKMDSMLLARVIGEHFQTPVGCQLRKSLEEYDLKSPADTLLSLIPHPSPPSPPPLPASISALASVFDYDLAGHLSARSLNNHWVIHSPMLTGIAHAVFPLASRCFNHSCEPSAICTYEFDEVGPTMEVKALRDLEVGEEITVPYLDPALPYSVRQRSLSSTYGFSCQCTRCTLDLSRQNIIPSAPDDVSSFLPLETALISHISPSSVQFPTAPDPLPPNLLLALNAAFLPYLSARFSDAAHDARYGVAAQAGLALLMLYLILYPRNYPLIGLHCLELAKTEWNGVLALPDTDREILRAINVHLTWAEDVLTISGARGSDSILSMENPSNNSWDSLKLLRTLIEEEESRA